jgi:hypothetical protein
VIVWEVKQERVDLTVLDAGEVVTLPAGWQPLQAERRSNELVLLLGRSHDDQLGGAAPA